MKMPEEQGADPDEEHRISVEKKGQAEAIEVEDIVSDVVLYIKRHCWTRRELADEV